MSKRLFCGLVVALLARASYALDLCTPATVNAGVLDVIKPYDSMVSVQAMMGCPPSMVTVLGEIWAVPVIDGYGGDYVSVAIDPATGGAGGVEYVHPLPLLPPEITVELAIRYRTGARWVRAGSQ